MSLTLKLKMKKENNTPKAFDNADKKVSMECQESRIGNDGEVNKGEIPLSNDITLGGEALPECSFKFTYKGNSKINWEDYGIENL